MVPAAALPSHPRSSSIRATDHLNVLEAGARSVRPVQLPPLRIVLPEGRTQPPAIPAPAVPSTARVDVAVLFCPKVAFNPQSPVIPAPAKGQLEADDQYEQTRRHVCRGLRNHPKTQKTWNTCSLAHTWHPRKMRCTMSYTISCIKIMSSKNIAKIPVVIPSILLTLI